MSRLTEHECTVIWAIVVGTIVVALVLASMIGID